MAAKSPVTMILGVAAIISYLFQRLVTKIPKMAKLERD